MSFQRRGWIQGRGARLVVEVEGGGGAGRTGHAEDLHPLAAFVLRPVEDASPAAVAVVHTGAEEAFEATSECDQSRRFPFTVGGPGTRLREAGNWFEGTQLIFRRAPPRRDHAHRALHLRRFDPDVAALPGE